MSSSDLTDQDFSSFQPEAEPEVAGSLGESPEATDVPRQREGLPRGFRMRHDAHFVDQLDAEPTSAVLRMLPIAGLDGPPCEDTAQIEALATSIRRVGLVEPLVVRRRGGRYEVIAGAKRLSAARRAQLEHVPCIVRDDLEDEAVKGWLAPAPASSPPSSPQLDDRAHGPFATTARERVLDEAIGALGSARRAIELTMPRSKELRARTAVDLVRAELTSTRQALTAMRVLSALPLVGRTTVAPKALVDAALSDLAPILRLLGARTSVTMAPGLPDLLVMQPLAAFAIEGCLNTVLTLAGDAPEPSLTIAVQPSKLDADKVTFAFRLERGWLPAETARRLADVDWGQHPGGVTTALVMAAAESVARAHRGGLDVSTDYDGFTIVLTLSCS